LEKISNLLDDVTIVNFKLLFKLVRRYSAHLYGTFFLFIILFAYFYFTQPVIFSSKVPVKVMARHSLSRDMSDFQQVESNNTVNIGELSSMTTSYSFVKSLATEIVKNPQFSQLNFGSITTGEKVKGNILVQKCNGNESCIIDRVTSHVGGLYSIEQGLTEDRFRMTINTLDEQTSLAVADALAKVIEQTRIQLRNYLVTQEINSVTKLMDEGRLGLQKENAFKLIEEQERNSQVIVELKERMKILQTALSAETSNYSSLEAKMNENKRVLSTKKPIDSFNKSKIRMIQQKIQELRANIISLSNIPESLRSISDKTILDQLKSELKVLEGKLPEEENIKSQEVEDAFGEAQRTKENDIRFEYLVSKNKVEKLQMDYDITKKELDELQKNKIITESDVSKFKSEIEFLKNLESKQLSLKLLSSTMTSDLQFEDPGKNVSQLRKTSPLKVFFFAMFLSVFVLLISLVVRYIIDDRIYSEDDISPYLKNLEFFGEAPSFE
jgi:hypothetical protein